MAVAGASCAIFSVSGVGKIRCWGPGGPSQVTGTSLAAGSTSSSMFALPFLTFSDATVSASSISLGLRVGCAVFTNLSLRCWGQRQSGGLGYYYATAGIINPSSAPAINLGAGLFPAHVTCNPNAPYCCSVTTTGALKCWGKCSHSTIFGYCLGTNTAWDGDVSATPLSTLPKIEFPAGAGPVVKVGLNRMNVEAVSPDVTAVLFADGRIRVFGDIGTTGLGGYNMATGFWGGTATSSTSLLPIVDFGPLAGRAIDIAIGFQAACALFSTSKIRCWGSAEGPFGFGPNAMTLSEMTLIPPVNPFPAAPRSIAIGHNTFTATFDSGFTAVGANYFGQVSSPRGSGGGRSVMPVSLVPPIAGITAAVPIGTKPSIALSHHGQYGASTCILRTDAKVICWGNSLSDFVVTRALKATYGLPESNVGGMFYPISGFPLTDVANLPFPATQIISYSGGDGQSGGGVVCAKMGTNGHACWGKNYLSGASTTQSCQLFYNAGSLLTALPWTPILVQTPDGCSACCCSNTWPSTPQPWFDLSVGYEHMCGIYTAAPSSKKTVFCWGGNMNQYGEIGVDVTDLTQLGCNAGVKIRGGLFNVAETFAAVSVHAGYRRTCAIFSFYTGYEWMVKCWGYNAYGETLNMMDIGAPPYMGEGTSLSTLGITAMANLPAPVTPDTHWKALSVSMGRSHTCLFMTKLPSNNYNDAACFGYGLNYRLGRGASEGSITLSSWDGKGLWESSMSFIAASPNVVRGVTAGYDHTCLLLRFNSLAPTQLDTICFGQNSFGQTGSILGANVDVPFDATTLPTLWNLPSGQSVAAVQAGRYNTCIQVSDGSVVCIGANHASQLGQAAGAAAIYHLGSYATADISIPEGCDAPASALTGLSVVGNLQVTPASFAPATTSYSVLMPASMGTYTAVGNGGMVWFEDNLVAPTATRDLEGACTASVGLATFTGALPFEGFTANITAYVVDSQRRGPLPSPATSYSLTVRRAYSDAKLRNLADSGGTVVTGPAAPRRFFVPFSVTAVPPVTASCNATTQCKVSLAGSAFTLTSVTSTLPPLTLGPNLFPLQVSPEDGPAVSYDFVIIRQDNNADLALLQDSAGLITSFSASTTTYAISLPSAVPSLPSLVARCASLTCAISASGAAAGVGAAGSLTLVNILVPSGGTAVALSVNVVSEDATASKTTVLRIRRMLADATATFADSAAGAPFLPLATTAATITPTCGDPAGCTVIITSTNANTSFATSSGVPITVPLIPGPNAFTCTVRAEDPAAPARTYTVNIRRGPFPSIDSTLLSAVEPVSNASAPISGAIVTARFLQAVPPNSNADLSLVLTCRAPLPAPCSITVPAGSGATCSCPAGSRACMLTVAAPFSGQTVRVTVAAEDPLAGATPYVITLVGAPVVLSVSPAFVSASALAVITVTGRDFGNAASEFGGVMTAGVSCVLSVWVSPVTARCHGIAAASVPAGVPALVTASTLVAGAGTSSSTVFIVPHPQNPSLAPVVTRVLPNNAEIGGGIAITITGRNLISPPSPTLVAVGDLTCIVRAATATLTFLVCDVRAPGASAPALVSLSAATQDGLYVPPAPNFSFTPVASKAIFVVNRAASTAADLPFTREDDPSVTVVIVLSLSVNVSSYLSVVAVVDPPSEARVLSPTTSFPIGSPANSSANFTIVGIPDRQRDGARLFSVSFEVSSGDPLLDRAYIPPVTLINRDSRPIGLAISPGVAPLLGGTTATVAGLNFDADSTFLLGGFPCRNVSVVSQELAIVVVPGSPSGSETYVSLQVIPGPSSWTSAGLPAVGAANATPATASSASSSSASEAGPALSKALFYNDACPTAGMLGSGARCRPCPRGGYCPGGERVRPLPGFWNSGEESGWVSECPLAATSCAGCRSDIAGEDRECYRTGSSACVFPYSGPMCGACAAGFYKNPAGSCLPCLSSGEVSAFLVGSVFMWGTMAVCSWRVRSHKVWSDIVEIILALQEAAGVGAMISQGLPPFAASWYRLLDLCTGDPTFFKGSCDGLPKVSEQYLASMGYALALGSPMWLFVIVFRRFVKSRSQGYTVGGLITRGLVTHGVLQYYNVLSQSLTLLACVKAGDGTRRLASWPHVQCFRGSHIPAFAVALALTVIVGVVGPMWYILYLYRNRGRMYADMSLISRFSLLYGGYKRRFRFFFVAEILVMVVLSIAKALLQARFLLQISLIGVVLTAQVLVMIILRPVHGRKQLFFVIVCIITNIGALVVIYLANTKRIDESSSRVPILAIMSMVALSLSGKILVVIWDATRDRRVFPGSKPSKWAVLEGEDDFGHGGGGSGGGGGDGEGDDNSEAESLPSDTDLLSPETILRESRPRKSGPLPPDPGVTELLFPGSSVSRGETGSGAAGPEASASMFDTFMALFGLGSRNPGAASVPSAMNEKDSVPDGTDPPGTSIASTPGASFSPAVVAPSSLPLWRVHSIVPRSSEVRRSTAISSRPPAGWTSGKSAVDVTANLGPIVQELLDATNRADLIGAGRDARSGNANYSRLEVVRVTRLEDTHRWVEDYALIAGRMRRQFEGRVAPRLRLATDSFWEDLMGPGNPRDLDLGESLLFHGTTASAAEHITRSATLDERMASTGLFGRGVYLSDHSAKADQYCTEDPATGLCTLFLARALLGVPFAALRPLPKDLRLPPCCMGCPGPCEHNPRFDSILGEIAHYDKRAYLNHHRELVIFDRRQIYVEFSVQFRRI